jgi:polysaccharide biosynthesis PFTS motif protein
MIESIVKRKRRRALWNMMRGYRILKKEGKLDLFLNIKEDIANQNIDYLIKGANYEFFTDTKAFADKIVKQFLMTRLAGQKFNAVILASIGNGSREISYPLPPNWFAILRKYGFKVSKGSSNFLFGIFLLKMLISGFFFSLTFLIKSIIFRNRGELSSMKNSVYFDSLSSSNLPKDSTMSYNIISWYLQWEGRKQNLRHIYHNVKNHKSVIIGAINLIGIDFPIKLYRSGKSYLSFIVWLLKSLLIIPLESFKGNWWNLALYKEASEAAAMRFQVGDLIDNQYLFHNSSWIYRPLWTYEAEKKGAEILFYFYSTNCESFKQETDHQIQANTWQLMNWPNYIVWDSYQKEFVERAVGFSSNITVAGNIWFSSSTSKIETLPANSVAVFDVQPIRDTLYQSLGIDFEYYLHETACSFLKDIHQVLTTAGATMVLKRKRDIGSFAHPNYRNYIKTLATYTNFIGVDADLATQEVIKQCELVISMPFTSTALIARSLGKKSIYYDPTKKVMKDDRAAHGIEIIQGIDELKIWLFETLRK